MKHEVFNHPLTERDLTGHVHPTPAAIRVAIFEALDADAKHTDPLSAPIPFRTYRLIREAITKACDDHERTLL
ncbi:hypothetical protein [Falsirhodobacter sp. 1013]|uniref:hypothetical protein n=1 Tax=Falsirhodobacter sp. 1013 TaxID=3417566 RepID=UPI003EBC6AC2